MGFGTRLNDRLYTAGQPSEEQFLNLPLEGFQRVIDVRPVAEEHGFDEPAEAAGLEYLVLPSASQSMIDELQRIVFAPRRRPWS